MTHLVAMEFHEMKNLGVRIAGSPGQPTPLVIAPCIGAQDLLHLLPSWQTHRSACQSTDTASSRWLPLPLIESDEPLDDLNQLLLGPALLLDLREAHGVDGREGHLHDAFDRAGEQAILQRLRPNPILTLKLPEKEPAQ